ncbi:hypothetical protein Esti_003721 [Eimeria stiedai]
MPPPAPAAAGGGPPSSAAPAAGGPQPLSERDGVVAAACCIGNALADSLPAFCMQAAEGETPGYAFTRSFLRLQHKFHSRGTQLQQQQQRLQEREAGARKERAKPLYWPDGECRPPSSPSQAAAAAAAPAAAAAAASAEDDLNIDGVISALLERNASAAVSTGSAAAASEPAEAEAAAADTAAAAAAAAARERDEKAERAAAAFKDVEPLSSDAIKQQLRLQLLAARHLQQGAPPPPALLHAIAAPLPPSIREEMCTRPAVILQLSRQLKSHSREDVLQQLEERRRLLDCILSDDPEVAARFQAICSLPDSVRRQALLERRLMALSSFQQRMRMQVLKEAQQQSIPLAELLLEPQPPRSIHEQAFCCGCCCISCCRGRPAAAAAAPGPTSRAALFAALDPLGLSDAEAPELVQKAHRARAVAAAAVRAVFSRTNKAVCLLSSMQRREHQRRLAWDRAVQQQAGQLHRHWSRLKETAAAVAAEAASQVAELEQAKQQLREKEQKERMRLLKENDMEAYMQLVKQTKNQRLQELLSATDEFLESLGRRVQVQKQEAQEGHRRSKAASVGAEGGGAGAGSRGLGSRDKYYSLSHAVREEVVQPKSLVGGTLMPYQMAGLQWMVSLHNNNLHGILADEMGLGKTIQTIALLAYLKECKNNEGPHLVIVPLSTLSNWADEFQRWAPSLKVMLFKGARLERRQLQRQLKQVDFNVCITTFDLAIREKNALASLRWKHLVVDEGHRMKNSKSKFHSCVSSFSASHRLLLTGTPLQNNLTELWSLLNFLLPKIFSCVDDFEKWFCQPFEVRGMNVDPSGSGDPNSPSGSLLNEEEQLLVINRLHAVLRPFLLRRVKKDVLKDMPDKKEYLVHIPLTEWQRVVYRSLQDKGIGSAREFFSKRSFHNTLMQLRKIANHPYLFVDEYTLDETLVKASGKFECLDRMLPKLIHFKHKTLIFSQMTQVLDLMADYLDMRNIKHERLDGSVGLQERKERIDSFNQQNEDAMVFMLSTRAGGLGLNLQAADTVILFDSDFNPHQDLQAMCRAHRVGQTKQVKVFRLVTLSGVEEVILQRANKKLSIDQKARRANTKRVIQAGMFDNKSTEDTREEKLRLLLLLGKSTGTDAKATTPKQLNKILSRSEEELQWFEQYDRKLLGVTDAQLHLPGDEDPAAAEQQALYEPPTEQEEEETPLTPQQQQREGQQQEQQQQQEAQKQQQKQSSGLAPGAAAEGEEEVKQFLEQHGRIVKASELPDWVAVAAAAASAAAAEAAAEAEAAAAEAEAVDAGANGGDSEGGETNWMVTSRKRRNISRLNYKDNISEAQYLRIVEKYENGELGDECLEEALTRAAERNGSRGKRQQRASNTPTTAAAAAAATAAAAGPTAHVGKRRGRRPRASRGGDTASETPACSSNDTQQQQQQQQQMEDEQQQQQQPEELEVEDSPTEREASLQLAS